MLTSSLLYTIDWRCNYRLCTRLDTIENTVLYATFICTVFSALCSLWYLSVVRVDQFLFKKKTKKKKGGEQRLKVVPDVRVDELFLAVFSVDS